MNNESIKEILEFLEDKRSYYKTLSQNTINKLLDYITNLQQELERLKEREDKLQTKFKDWKKEIEKEKKYYLCDRTDCCGRIKGSKKYNSIYCELKDYKSRCEKAIEYINKHKIEYIDKHFEDDNVMVEFNEYTNPQALLELLQGGKDE